MLDDDGRPVGMRWDYTRGEIIADAVVHALGNVFSLGAAIAILCVGIAYGTGGTLAASLIYATCLMAALAISAAYNLWPINSTKWWLRRFDHATIFLLIAGTYTPLLTKVPDPWINIGLLGFVWVAAVGGVALKLLFPGRFDRLAILLYLGLGWSGIFAAVPIYHALSSAMVPIAIGGLLYSFGVIFYVWESLRFQNAIWHGFVLAAAACHFVAILMTLVAV